MADPNEDQAKQQGQDGTGAKPGADSQQADAAGGGQQQAQQGQAQQGQSAESGGGGDFEAKELQFYEFLQDPKSHGLIVTAAEVLREGQGAAPAQAQAGTQVSQASPSSEGPKAAATADLEALRQKAEGGDEEAQAELGRRAVQAHKDLQARSQVKQSATREMQREIFSQLGITQESLKPEEMKKLVDASTSGGSVIQAAIEIAVSRGQKPGPSAEGQTNGQEKKDYAALGQYGKNLAAGQSAATPNLAGAQASEEPELKTEEGKSTIDVIEEALAAQAASAQ